MTSDVRERALKMFKEGVRLVEAAKQLQVSRSQVREWWVKEHGESGVRLRGKKARSGNRSRLKGSALEKAQARAKELFYGEESLKSVASQVGVHFTVVRRWWKEEHGEEGFNKRSRELQRKKATASNITKTGKARRTQQTQAVCEKCEAKFTLSRGSKAKRKTYLCPACASIKRNPMECPVCGLVCEGQRGLSSHFRHQAEDEKHAKHKAQKLLTKFEGMEEGTEYVRCRVCGFEAKSLSSHIRTHDLTWAEYARKYPGSSLWSDDTYEFRNRRIRETHHRLGLDHAHLAPYLDDNGDLVVLAAAKGLKVSQESVRTYAKLLGIPTRNRLAAQRKALEVVSKILGERYQWEWSHDEIRNPETGFRVYYDGYFRRHNLLVEYHGPQHFQFVPRWHRTPEGFERQQEMDRFKAQKAQELGLGLVVIPYTEPLTEDHVRGLIEQRGDYLQQQAQMREKAKEVLEDLRSRSFPYLQKPTPEEATQVLHKLSRIRQRLDQGIILPRSYTGNKLCRRYFPNIYTARRKGHPSAVECWEDDRELEKAIFTQMAAGHPTSPERVLKALTFHHRLPAVFRPAFARFLCERYCRRGALVWDPCSGYGGRLLGAAAAGVRYIGTDIEPETVHGNKALARDLGYKADVRLVSALDAEIPPVEFVFTSPPYFDVEQYSDREGQPHISYDNRSDWVRKFLVPLVRKSAEVLTKGGHFAVVLPDDLHPEVERSAPQFELKFVEEVGFELPNGKVSRAVVYRK